MDLFSAFSFFIAILVANIILFIVMAGIFYYTEIYRLRRRYRRPVFYPGRCPECGSRVLTRIRPCQCRDRDFSQNSEGTKIQHRDL